MENSPPWGKGSESTTHESIKQFLDTQPWWLVLNGWSVLDCLCLDLLPWSLALPPRPKFLGPDALVCSLLQGASGWPAPLVHH